MFSFAAAAAEIPVPQTVRIGAGPFIFGSDRSEREMAYKIDEAAYGHSGTRDGSWYEAEIWRNNAVTGAYSITTTPITNAEYLAFVVDTGHRVPDVDARTWASYGLIHPYKRTRRYAWLNGRPPRGRENHPVVLVSYSDAKAYAGWLSAKTGRKWRLPFDTEWEKAARGVDGRAFPWGNIFDKQRLNSRDAGPFDTVAVGSYKNGASPFGMLDAAGQVYEWTSTPTTPGTIGSSYIVKGGSWDDKGCGVCRPAARHGRPKDIKHIIIGFRLVLED